MIRVGHSIENMSQLRRLALNPAKGENCAGNRRNGEAEGGGLGLGAIANDTSTSRNKMRLPYAKGVGKFAIVWKHALRNAIIAPLTFGGLLMAGFATGSVLTETIFAWPGIGVLALNAVFNNDFPILVGSVLVFAVIYVLAAFLIDVMYAAVDPRIRYS